MNKQNVVETASVIKEKHSHIHKTKKCTWSHTIKKDKNNISRKQILFFTNILTWKYNSNATIFLLYTETNLHEKKMQETEKDTHIRKYKYIKQLYICYILTSPSKWSYIKWR